MASLGVVAVWNNRNWTIVFVVDVATMDAGSLIVSVDPVTGDTLNADGAAGVYPVKSNSGGVAGSACSVSALLWVIGCGDAFLPPMSQYNTCRQTAGVDVSPSFHGASAVCTMSGRDTISRARDVPAYSAR